MPVTIRPAVASEAGTLTALTVAGKRHWGYPDAWLEAWRGALTITPEYVAANVVFCAEDGGGRLVGYYALERDGDRLRLENLFLEPSFIGHGLGRRLFEHAVQTARSLGAAELFIEADPNAEAFYLHLGARRIGEAVSRVTGTERVVPQLLYALPGATAERHAPGGEPSAPAARPGE
jgi:GNAT superfamily N-acetyltransferase